MDTKREMDKERLARLRLAIAARHARRGPARWLGESFASVLILGVKLYQWTLSPLKNALFGAGAGCRFRPTCSAYAIDCFRTLPLGRAAYYSVYRILRCNPWGGSGYDPAPGTIFLDKNFVPEKAGPRSLADMVEGEEWEGR